MGGKGSYAGRALIAVGLFFGSYALALGLAGLLLWIPYAEVVYIGHLHIKLALGAVLCAFGILKGSIFVPAPRFEPPGPEVQESDEPALFALIRGIAVEMKTAMPSKVFLIPDVNAFVTEVGGFMGIGSKRIMGIGLGLLAVDNVSQLKATIAHEFGHYVGGDTSLGGFVYRTRAAIGRVLGALHGSWLSKPFELYAQLFLKVSHGVSRAQELAADRASVAIAGKNAHVSGLEREGRGSVMFETFLSAEVSPLLSSGFCPDNLYEGFRTFSTEVFTSEKVAEVDAMLSKRETDPYDTHPALTERIAYAKSLPDSAVVEDERPATSLLSDPSAVERKVSRHIGDNHGDGRRLESVAWKDVSARVYGPKLSEEAKSTSRKVSRAFACDDTPPAALRSLVAKLAESDALNVALLLEPELRNVESNAQDEIAPHLVARFLGVLLGAKHVEAGGAWQSDIGKPHQILMGGEVHEPFRVASEAVNDSEKLRALATTLGLLKSA